MRTASSLTASRSIWRGGRAGQGAVHGGEGAMRGRGVCVVGVCMAERACEVRGNVWQGGVHAGGVCGGGGGVRATHVPPVDRHAGVKTLPCPKLRLRAVKYTLCSLLHFNELY